MSANQGSTTVRNIPDVAMVGVNLWSTWGNGKSGESGGTSCSTPLWAGFTALVNQQAALHGQPAAGFLNPALYALGTSSGYASDFHDIVKGNNTNQNSLNEFVATAGYDLCTGWGSPDGTNLINALISSPDPLEILPLSGFTCHGPAGGPFDVSGQTFLLTNHGTNTLKWSAIDAPYWLSLSTANGTLVAGAQTNLLASLNASASNLMVGVYTASLWISNRFSHVAQSRLFTLQAGQPLALIPAAGFVSGGPAGGPFNLTSQNYVLTNTGEAPVNWNLLNTSLWLNASLTGGTLAPAGQTSITMSLNNTASNLTAGVYDATVLFTNLSSGGAWPSQFTFLPGQGLVQNGGFETGDFTGWTLVGDPTDNLVDDGLYITPHSGNYAAALGEAGELAWLSQTLPTFGGQPYLLSFWLASPDGETPNVFTAAWNGTSLYAGTNLAAFGWTNLEFLVQAGNPDAVLQFGAQDDNSYLGLDDVNVTSVPVPEMQITNKGRDVIQFSCNALGGLRYQLQSTINLAAGVWTNSGSAITATNGIIIISAPNAPGFSRQQFYRIVVSP
jgi:hypothetical protein